MPHYHRIVLYFDGASRNNPRGPAGCGWALYEMNDYGADSRLIASASEFLGNNISNNQAEYEGLERGLQYIANNLDCHGLYIRGDAEIVIRQMEGKYQVRSNNILPYYVCARSELSRIDCEFYKFRHIPRVRNYYADYLANEAIERG